MCAARAAAPQVRHGALSLQQPAVPLPCLVVLVLSAKGGVGKSTVASALAAAVAVEFQHDGHELHGQLNDGAKHPTVQGKSDERERAESSAMYDMQERTDNDVNQEEEGQKGAAEKRARRGGRGGPGDMALMHRRVGLVDVDVCGPSIPAIFCVKGTSIIANMAGKPPPVRPTTIGVHGIGDPWSLGDRLALMSISLVLKNADAAALVKAPKKERTFTVEVKGRDVLSPGRLSRVDKCTHDAPRLI